MASLFFPNAEALRVALVSGIVPSAVAREVVNASFDKRGGIWLASKIELPGEAYPPLNRLGAKANSSHSGEAAKDYPCWAALIPLRRIEEHAAVETVLFEMPTVRLGRFIGTLERLSHRPVRFSILDRASVVIVERPPHYLLELAGSANEKIARYRPLARNVWRLAGFNLDGFPAKLLDTENLTLAAPERVWRTFPQCEFHTSARPHSLASSSVASTTAAVKLRIPIDLRLVRSPLGEAADETLWIAPGDWHAGHFRDWDERLLRRLEIAVVKNPDGTSRTLIRMARNARLRPIFSPPFLACVSVPGSDRIFVPSGSRLTPHPRGETLNRILRTDREALVWFEPHLDAFALYRTNPSAFRPLSNSVVYRATPANGLQPLEEANPLFTLPGFVAIPETKPQLEFGAPPVPAQPQRGSRAKGSTGWLHRISGRLFASRKERASIAGSSPAETLDSEATPHPNEWAARRNDLEKTILAMPTSVADSIRAQAWRELAKLATAMGHPADAALAWIQAIWNKPSPPAEWVEAWLKAEISHGKITGTSSDTELLARKPNASLARILAALLVERSLAESQSRTEHENFAMLRVVEAFATDLPVRLVWLARTAAAQLSQGDALGLARCRDRLFARTSEGGPALDLDSPSFLRFQGKVGAERFHAAADWLRKTREGVHRWLKELGSPGRLQWAGLEADIPSTRAYADLIFAYGMAKLGDRSKSLEWQEQAEAILTKAEGPGVEPAVHRYLLESFRRRIRIGHFDEVRTGAEQIPFPEFAQKELSQYAVAKLQAHLGVFGSHGNHDPYGHRGLQSLIPVREYHAESHDVKRLLTEAASERTAGNLSPRVLLALEFVRTSEEAAEVLALLPLALELLPEALHGIGVAGADVRLPFVRRGIRAVELACRLATKYHCGDTFAKLCMTLLRGSEANANDFREVLHSTAGKIFATCRALELTEETAEMINELSRRSPAPLVEQLPLAIGWFALGENERGMRHLNDARRMLFETGQTSEKERGNLALAYVQALAHAPAALALGRLEELFQRLDRIAVGGAASRYYALKPLEIIDAAVAAVVTDEFALDPAAKVWLTDDEYRIRQKIVRDLDLALATDTRTLQAP